MAGGDIMVAPANLDLVDDQVTLVERHAAARLATPVADDQHVRREVIQLIEWVLLNCKQLSEVIADWDNAVRQRPAVFSVEAMAKNRELSARLATVAGRLLALADGVAASTVAPERVSRLRLAHAELERKLAMPVESVIDSLGLQLNADDLRRLSLCETPLESWPEEPDDLFEPRAEA